MATAAIGGAAIVASVTRWWLLGPMHGPVAMILAGVVGGYFGAMLSHSIRVDAPDVTAQKAVFIAVIAGPATAIAVKVLCEASDLGIYAAAVGGAFAVVLLPCAFLAVHLARAAARSRERSIVGQSDRRAAWRTTALWLSAIAAIGAIPALVDGTGPGLLSDIFWWRLEDKEQLTRAPLFVSLAASVIAGLVALCDAHAEHVLGDAHQASGAWRAEAGGEAAASLDIGIGDQAWMEHVSGRATYREHAEERVAAVGDVNAGYAFVRSATRRSIAALAFAAAIEIGVLFTYARLVSTQ